jgi:hypothetical protein
MAYKKGKGKMARFKKIEPAVQTMWVTVSTSAGATTNNFVDLSQIASLVNRRFYRQGINWAVSGIETYSTISTDGVEAQGNIIISKLPSTWVMSNAWEKGFRSWQRMNNEALEEAPSVRPRFLDFKIYADATHHALGFGANLLPGSLVAQATAGEWEPSQYHIPSASPGYLAADREVLAVGASYPGNGASGFNAVSLIEGYASGSCFT